MKTSVELLDGNTVKLTVTVPASDVARAIDRAYRDLAKQVKVPGFRPGKAPKPVIDTHVGREAILGEAQESILHESYPLAVDAEGLKPIASPDIGELDEVIEGGEYTYSAEVQVKPELSLSSTEGLSIVVPPAEASDREIDAQIEHMRGRFASLEPVDDRGIAAEDFVLLSFTGTVDGEAYEGNTVDKYLYEMSRGLMPSEFDDGLLGSKAGDEVQVEFEIPDTSSNPEFVGKTAAFEIAVHEVKAKVLPQLDDEFASTAGGYETFAEMRADIKTKLDEAKRTGRERILERKAREAISERLEGDVPDAMIESRSHSMLSEFVESLQARGMTVEQYAEATGYEPDRIREDVVEQAAAAVREDLALEALFRMLGMEVTEADIDEEVERFAEAAETTGAEIRKRWEDTRALEVLSEQVMYRKAIEWLSDEANVEIIEKDPSADAQEPPEGTDTADTKE